MVESRGEGGAKAPLGTMTKYPRKSVLEHRERLADDATRGLSRAVAERERADHEKQTAEDARRRAAEEAERARREEGDALARGELKAADLASQGAWEVRVAAEARAMDARVAESASKADAARDEERAAARELGNRKADVDVLVKDRERYEAAQKKRAEAREEEAAAEAHRPTTIKG
jgi:hypothetical protein